MSRRALSECALLLAAPASIVSHAESEQQEIVEFAGAAQPVAAVNHHAFAVDVFAMSLNRNAARL